MMIKRWRKRLQAMRTTDSFMFRKGAGLRRSCSILVAVWSCASLVWTQNPSVPSKKVIEPAVQFVDVTSKLGVRFKHEASPTTQKYLIEMMGSALAQSSE